MNPDQVFCQFLLFSGLSPESGENWKPLCDAATARISAAMRTDADPNDPRLVLAAAGEAYCQYHLMRAGDGAQSFKVGDISVSESNGVSFADELRSMRDELYANAAGLLDCSFAGLWKVDG